MADKKVVKQKINESLDNLFRQSMLIRNGSDFKKFLDFVSRFKEYKPYNNMLVYLQNPECAYFATEKDWRIKFHRKVIKSARPMIILAPMTPVLFVYDPKDTEGDKPLPEFLFSTFELSGEFKGVWFSNLKSHLAKHKIKLTRMPLSPTHGGSISRKSIGFEIVINSNMDEGVNFSTLIHELGHLFLGHLGSEENENYPLRPNIKKTVEEIEAESIAYLVLMRFGLENKAAEYLAFYNSNPYDFDKVSFDLIIKSASKIEEMIKKPAKAQLELFNN